MGRYKYNMYINIYIYKDTIFSHTFALYGKILVSYSQKTPPLPRLHQYISKVSQKHSWQWQHLTLRAWQWPNLCQLKLLGFRLVRHDFKSSQFCWALFCSWLKQIKSVKSPGFDVSSWWLFANPIWTICESQIESFPQGSGWTSRIFETISFSFCWRVFNRWWII